MREIKHWFRHEWVTFNHQYVRNTSQVETVICNYPGCGVRRLRDPRTGILFGPTLK